MSVAVVRARMMQHAVMASMVTLVRATSDTPGQCVKQVCVGLGATEGAVYGVGLLFPRVLPQIGQGSWDTNSPTVAPLIISPLPQLDYKFKMDSCGVVSTIARQGSAIPYLFLWCNSKSFTLYPLSEFITQTPTGPVLANIQQCFN